MGEVIHLEPFRAGEHVDPAIRRWARGLGVDLKPRACIADLPDSILLMLAEGGAKGNDLLDALILAAWGARGEDPRQLPAFLRMRLVDLSLLLMDQLHFECMYRLGWIEPLEARRHPLAQFLHSRPGTLQPLRLAPSMKKGHCDHRRFEALPDRERETLLRRQIPAALEQFRRQTEGRH